MDEMTYRTPRTSSPAEIALVAAHNAGCVPLGGDDSRFTMIAYVAEAMDALDKVSHHDQITRDMVRERIGRAQARFGFQ